MEDILQRLAEQAGLHREIFMDNPEVLVFAELIVREAALIANRHIACNLPLDGYKLRAQFGVEA